MTSPALAALCLFFMNPISADESLSSIRQSVEAAISRIQSSKPPSVSSGRLQNGRLDHAAELPKPSGVGYRIIHPDRDTNFGADRMVFGLMRLGVVMHEKLGDEPHSQLHINEISDRDGGKQLRHINHQMGLDVDIVFYCTDLSGTPQRSRWVSFDERGLSEDGDLRFDAARNWIMIDAILSSETFRKIRSLLIADALKKQLLDHAMSLHEAAEGDKAERLREGIKRAMELLRQPASSPHDNHLHLSLQHE
ncbi:penicillin-insensitive murein endopeptidase [Neorhodopirellula pilleata]|uniref:penicillin-insensitive murein endopeptidase n=1 Tax=Neorhodopirellula pilleata TaxID=2714738 RepID=UPI001E2E8A4A|nr:penicillin-insensitive murein endopeptidase [Neorhodopirellula pilleata]